MYCHLFWGGIQRFPHVGGAGGTGISSEAAEAPHAPALTRVPATHMRVLPMHCHDTCFPAMYVHVLAMHTYVLAMNSRAHACSSQAQPRTRMSQPCTRVSQPRTRVSQAGVLPGPAPPVRELWRQLEFFARAALPLTCIAKWVLIY